MLHSIITIVTVILLIDLHLSDASDCIHLWPYNPRSVDGEPLLMWCSISVSPNCTFKASDLIFSIGSIQVEQRMVTILNDSTVQMTYPRISLSFNQDYIFCKIRSVSGDNSSMVDTTLWSVQDVQRLSVGYRPFMPSIKKDYKVFNWEYLEFQWTVNHTDPIYHTTYEAWFKRTIDPDFIQCGNDRKISRQIGRTCKILSALDFVHPNGILFFKVNGSNAVGSVSTDIEDADLYHIIQPGPVRNVTVVSSVETGINVSFHAPKKEKRLKYNISIHCGSKSWNVHTSKQRSPGWSKLDLSLPPFANCSLSISCLPFHNRQYWSEPSEPATFISPDAVPLKAPEICCIEINPTSPELREVTVYFKPLTSEEARGVVTKYHYHLKSLRSDEKLGYSEDKRFPPNATSLRLELYKETDSTIAIEAETRAGRNHSVVSFLSIPSQKNIVPPPGNTTTIWVGSETVRVSWMKADGDFGYVVLWCQSSSDSCESPVNWMKTESTFLDVELPQTSLYLRHRFGIVTTSLGGSRISSIKWIKCIYTDKVASAPVVRLFNKTSRSIYLTVEKPKDCAFVDQGYIYEYQIEYGNGKRILTVTKSAFDHDAVEDWLFAFKDLMPESNYTFSVIAMTTKGPSEAYVYSASTASSEELEAYQLILIIIGSCVGLLLILLGIYTCCKWNREQFLKLRRWLHMDITVPNKHTMNDRGTADGNNLSSSYMSLSKKETSFPLESQLCDLNQSDFKSDDGCLKETVFFADSNERNLITAEESSDMKSKNTSKKENPVKSPSCPSSLQKCKTSNRNSSGIPPKFTSADQVNQNGVEQNRQSQPSEETNDLLSHHPSRRSASQNSEISGIDRQNAEGGTRSTASAEQNDTLNRSSGESDSGTRNNLSSVGSDEIDDYSNVRTSIDGCDEFPAVPDSYSRARLSSDEETEENQSYGHNYSRALLRDDMVNNFSEPAQPPVQLDGNFSCDEDDRRDDDVNYSTASMIKRTNC